jgi:O-antigen/teichoic acid export membrane protein
MREKGSMLPVVAQIEAAEGLDASTPNDDITSLSHNVSRLASGSGISILGRAAGRASYTVGQVLLARLLGPANFGLYAIGWTLLRIAGVIAPIGLDQAVVRFGAHYYGESKEKLKGALLHCIGYSLLSGLALAVACWFGAPWLAQRVFHKPQLASLLHGFAMAIPLCGGAAVVAAATRITQRMKFSIIIEDLFQQGSAALMILVLFLVGGSLRGAVEIVVASYGISLLVGLFIVWRLFRRELSSDIIIGSVHREILSFSPTVLLAGAFGMLMLWVDRLVLAQFRSATEVGIYQAASQTTILFEMILAALSMTIAPMIVDLHRKRNHRQVEELYRISTKWALYLSAPLFLLLGFAARDFLVVVFGPGYAGGWLPLTILLCGQLANVGTGTVGLLLLMTGRERRWLLLTLGGFLANLVLAVLLVPRYGMVGAAASTAISTVAHFLVAVVQVCGQLKIFPYDRRFTKILVATGSSACLLLVMHRMRQPTPLLRLGLTAVMGGGGFLAILLMLGLDLEDWELLRLLRVQISTRLGFQPTHSRSIGPLV